ncbi:uncharacterized protein ASPGLDRAFT_69380 [Aspergillus glaucus CBS 516.65]|uniref:Uncharacterized protein n=1 Tax=Aspergillus glaucus CBS 516.65 TaxID=1160497 RepID=A0A1L9V9Q2_ASPGL|nr:hypothetical protein ASPGLDRAFT_69380 [Aspergillus glaucus CBS 516.65]OJJ80605.1 hypothetical protein ASPGLDRAFT_69380 [Aspergillus glaucus CBS 516.65]
MSLAVEWNSYSVHRKGLRVSTFLHGHQWSTYFLSLPYRYAIPLIACSGILHWLISRSLYIVNIQARGFNHGREPYLDSVTCAYSPVGIISGVLVSGFYYAGLPSCGGISTVQNRDANCWKLQSGLAIAAACHSSYVEKDNVINDGEDNSEKQGAEYQRLKWGVEPLIPSEIKGQMGHCAFSSGNVEIPQHGRAYL